MPSNDDHARLRNLGTVIGAPESGLRYMRRRRIGTADRNGDPLDGLANLFNVALVLAVGLLVAVLTAAGVTGLLTSENMTIVTNPGTPEMQVIVKEGGTITKLDTESGAEVAGAGTLIGSFYRLTDGTVIYVPSGEAAPSGAAPLPGASPAPGETAVPGVTPTPAVTATPTPVDTAFATPTPTVTLTPDTGDAEDFSRGTP
jgi:hypothetical protein